ncbi:sugar-phosphatase [Sporolactobacillus pectinivorans]|uniref:sugar-phosphatase n=1 Tax=Sporolactobacillus pectinivorans TaxID=1591408 RepID=UPI000C26056A|nr:sugar-phosphatase [Sporolactobacillus pectinivorans]
MIKLIAIDLDGTLLNDEKKISLNSRHALLEAKKMGVKIVICSGRPIAGIREYLDFLGLNEAGNYAITYNGGLVQETDSGTVLSEKILTRNDIISLYTLSQKLGVPMNFIDRENVYCPIPPEGRPSLYGTVMHSLPFIGASMERLPGDLKVNKVVFCTEQQLLDSAIQEIPESFREKYTLMKSRTILLEIMNRDVDKGRGLQALGKYLNIRAEEIMTLGDQENDLAMIRYAGTGVAMGNAIQKVKDAAQFVTKTNIEDGVAFAVEKFVLTQ